MDEIIAGIFSSGALNKEVRPKLKAELEKATRSPKATTLVHSRFFEHAKEHLAKGASVDSVIDILADLTRMLHGQEAESPIKAIGFSPGPSCKKIIIEHLRGAKKSLDICVFTISDNEISAEIKAAHQRGIKTRIITDNDKSLDEGSDILLLAKLGIEIKVDMTDNHMHHKFSIADGSELITGSFNWTKSAEAHNQENIISIVETVTIKEYIGEFEKLWKNLKAY